jgi:hypothetical protein
MSTDHVKEPVSSSRAASAAGPANRPRRALAYAALATAALGLVVWGVHTHRDHVQAEQARAEANAEHRAQQLQKRFAAAGLPLYGDIVQVSRSLGTDGGPVCEAPDRTLALGFLKLQLSADGQDATSRPVVLAREELRGEHLIIRTYCPEKLGAGMAGVIRDLRLATSERRRGTE